MQPIVQSYNYSYNHITSHTTTYSYYQPHCYATCHNLTNLVAAKSHDNQSFTHVTSRITVRYNHTRIHENSLIVMCSYPKRAICHENTLSVMQPVICHAVIHESSHIVPQHTKTVIQSCNQSSYSQQIHMKVVTQSQPVVQSCNHTRKQSHTPVTKKTVAQSCNHLMCSPEDSHLS